jgi:hypothetical protein
MLQIFYSARNLKHRLRHSCFGRGKRRVRRSAKCHPVDAVATSARCSAACIRFWWHALVCSIIGTPPPPPLGLQCLKPKFRGSDYLAAAELSIAPLGRGGRARDCGSVGGRVARGYVGTAAFTARQRTPFPGDILGTTSRLLSGFKLSQPSPTQPYVWYGF